MVLDSCQRGWYFTYSAALSLETDQTVEKSHFAKTSVFPLFMDRFEKFKIWHTQDFDPDMGDFKMNLRDDVMRTRTSLMTSFMKSEVMNPLV